jgi:ribA/ribD-fused uncharacterized protein
MVENKYVTDIFFYGLCQKDAKGKTITDSNGKEILAEYAVFSNFFPAVVFLDGYWWLTAEHYYQAQKNLSMEHLLKVMKKSSPSTARYAGQKAQCNIRADWELVKVPIMRKVVRAKFTQNLMCAKFLLATGDKNIHEAGPANNYWGFTGSDMLGKILIDTRTELRECLPPELKYGGEICYTVNDVVNASLGMMKWMLKWMYCKNK